jgi:hypothetical protein
MGPVRHSPLVRSPVVHACSVLLGLYVASCTVRANESDASWFFRDGGPRDGGAIEDGGPPDAPEPVDSGPVDASVFIDPDAACASANVPVELERLPVDIIWVVDNSASMQPSIEQVQAGLNAFAERITASGFDYRVILLSLRGVGTRTISGSTRYQICIPPPLAGDSSCGDGERFFHVNVDIKSTQPVEQFLGTLGQTVGYTEGAALGSAPWRALLREGATKTIVVVTDDNARTCARPHSGGSCNVSGAEPLTETSLEDYPGGINPFTATRALGPGILTATYGRLFEGYTFNGIYGWGSATDPNVACTYAGTSSQPSPGWTYTTLVQRTGGVRAQICDGASAWGPFFESVASTVERTSRIACEVDLPPPPDGTVLNASQVNVQVRGESGTTTFRYTGSADGCDPAVGGWHYDDAAAPTRVILCPASCDFARAETTTSAGGLDVLFGCTSIPI